MEPNYQEYPGTLFIGDPVDEYFHSLPPGYRFAPTDEELIIYYLHKKILKEELPINRFRELDIYQYHPQYLAETQLNRDGEKEWYFFTPRERKCLHGSRPNRTQRSGDGFWKVTGSDDAITSATGEPIGFKNTLDYFEGTHSENQKTKWKMHEYRLTKSEKDEDKGHRNMTLDDCVLCKIYTSNRCKAGKTNKKNKRSAKKPFNSDPDRDVEQEHQDQDSGGLSFSTHQQLQQSNQYTRNAKFYGSETRRL